MADKKNTHEPKLYVKLGDKGSIFYDIASDTKIVGTDIVEVDNTLQITTAIRNGALKKSTKAEYDKQGEPKTETVELTDAQKKAKAEADAKAKEEAEKAKASNKPAAKSTAKGK